jgi:hypothetical protein
MTIDDLATFFWRMVNPFGNMGDAPLQRIADAIRSKPVAALAGSAGAIGQLKEAVKVLQDYSSNMTAMSEAIKGDEQSGVVGALTAVQKMVDSANELNKVLSTGDLNKLNIKAGLERVAGGIGLGKKGNYEIKNNGVTIQLNLTVNMKVNDVERAIIDNANSIIRDRLEFATDTNPGKKAQTPLAAQAAAPFSQTVPEK